MRALAAARDLRGILKALNGPPWRLSQRRIAARTGLAQTTISAELRGVQAVSSTVLIRQALAGLGAPLTPATQEVAVDPIGDVFAALETGSMNLVRQIDVGSAAPSIRMLDKQLRQVADRYLTVPLAEIAEALTTVSQELAGRWSQPLPPSVSKDVLVLQAWCALLASWLSMDATRPQAAAVHAHAAEVAARETGHEGNAAWAAMCRRAIAYWPGRRRKAAEHARVAWQAGRKAGGGAAVITASALAQDLAYLGEHREASRLLDEARRAVESEPTQDSDLGGPLACGLSRACGYWTETYLSLGDAATAVRVAREGMEAARIEWVRNIGSERMLTVHLGMGLLRLGEVEEAMAAVEPLLDVPVEVRARPLILRMGAFGRALPSGGEADALKERIRAFTDL